MNMPPSRRSLKLSRKQNRGAYWFRGMGRGGGNPLYDTKSFLDIKLLKRLNEAATPLVSLNKLPPLKRKERLDVSRFI